jgi:hypothetical protein
LLEIAVLKTMLLLLHVIPVLNQMGPTHTRILDMIFASFSTFELNAFLMKFLFTTAFSKRKLHLMRYLNLSRMNNSSIWYWKVLMIIIMAST